MYNLIFKRRSVRFFKDTDISKVDMREILRAGMWAPSAKNRQPWKFIVVKGESKKTALALMEKGIERSEKGEGVLAGAPELFTNARFTLQCMKQAPVLVFIVNPQGRPLTDNWTAAEKSTNFPTYRPSAPLPKTWPSRLPPWASEACGSATSSSPTMNSMTGWAKGKWSWPCPSATPTTTPAPWQERAKTTSSKSGSENSKKHGPAAVLF